MWLSMLSALSTDLDDMPRIWMRNVRISEMSMRVISRPVIIES